MNKGCKCDTYNIRSSARPELVPLEKENTDTAHTSCLEKVCYMPVASMLAVTNSHRECAHIDKENARFRPFAYELCTLMDPSTAGRT